MNRRAFLAQAAQTSAGIILPGLMLPAEEPIKRYWALGQLPQQSIFMEYSTVDESAPLIVTVMKYGERVYEFRTHIAYKSYTGWTKERESYHQFDMDALT